MGAPTPHKASCLESLRVISELEDAPQPAEPQPDTSLEGVRDGVCWMSQAPRASACDLPDSRHRVGWWGSLEAGSPTLSASPWVWLLGG